MRESDVQGQPIRPSPPPEASETRDEVRAPVCFTSDGERDALLDALVREGLLIVCVEPLAAGARGHLASVIAAAIERELSRRGTAAPTPKIDASSTMAAALTDQLHRARRLGARGLCVVLGPLGAVASSTGTLEPEDSATLCGLSSATPSAEIMVVLEADDRTLGGYGDPMPLAELLGSRSRPRRTEAPPARRASTSPAPSGRLESRSRRAAGSHVAPSKPATPPAAPPPPVATAHEGDSLDAEHDGWRAWSTALTAARGPQPLSAFEKLFSHSYLPLSHALAAGLTDDRASTSFNEFRRGFIRSYSESFSTFAVTGKRPRMVLDAPELAARIARLHGARSTHLLLVDAMRWDLGVMVKAALTQALGRSASLTDEIMLWSALPSTTTRQLGALARGLEALKSTSLHDEMSEDPIRDRTAEIIRRVKIGARDVFKLDLVEAKLRENLESPLAALPMIADAVAMTIARHAAQLAPRTLLFVFGDHGFTIDAHGTIRHGGASPEEVLVPGYALLLGEVH